MTPLLNSFLYQVYAKNLLFIDQKNWRYLSSQLKSIKLSFTSPTSRESIANKMGRLSFLQISPTLNYFQHLNFMNYIYGYTYLCIFRLQSPECMNICNNDRFGLGQTKLIKLKFCTLPTVRCREWREYQFFKTSPLSTPIPRDSFMKKRRMKNRATSEGFGITGTTK